MGTLEASALATSSSRPGIHIPENFQAVLATGLDEVRKRELNRPSQSQKYFRIQQMKKATHKFQSYYGLGTVSENRDSEELPYDEMGLGFDWELSVNTFRGAIKIEKELVEDELYGVISDRQQELVESERLSRELVLADMFNRAQGASGAPTLCEDGMYFLDDERPNAFKRAGLWGNLLAISAITPTYLFDTQLEFRNYRDERDQKSPMMMRKMIIRPAEEETVWEILKSDLRPTDAMNAKNYQFGRFEYETFDMMTAQQVLFYAGDSFSSSKNELYYGDRVSPEINTWTSDGGDVTHQRVRSRFGIGCGRPHAWRGGPVS